MLGASKVLFLRIWRNVATRILLSYMAGSSDITLRYRDMARQEEEEVGLLSPDSDIDENLSKARRSRRFPGSRPRYQKVFAAMLCAVVVGLAVLSILTAWVLLPYFVRRC